jgi:hypothetical protein
VVAIKLVLERVAPLPGKDANYHLHGVTVGHMVQISNYSENPRRNRRMMAACMSRSADCGTGAAIRSWMTVSGWRISCERLAPRGHVVTE